MLKQSIAIVFLDIHAALYSVIKQMVSGAAKGMRSLSEVFQKMQLPLEMYDAFLEQVRGVNLIREATGSDITSRNIAAMLGHTWFVVRDGHDLQSPMTGSRP